MHSRLRGEQRLLESRLSRSAVACSSATVASSRFKSASALVNWVNAPSGSAEPFARAASRALFAASRALARFAQVRRFGFLRALQLRVGVPDTGLNVGDQRRQGGDRVVNVVGGAVHRVE